VKKAQRVRARVLDGPLIIDDLIQIIELCQFLPEAGLKIGQRAPCTIVGELGFPYATRFLKEVPDPVLRVLQDMNQLTPGIVSRLVRGRPPERRRKPRDVEAVGSQFFDPLRIRLLDLLGLGSHSL